jgi:hypothetical protein
MISKMANRRKETRISGGAEDFARGACPAEGAQNRRLTESVRIQKLETARSRISESRRGLVGPKCAIYGHFIMALSENKPKKGTKTAFKLFFMRGLMVLLENFGADGCAAHFQSG